MKSNCIYKILLSAACIVILLTPLPSGLAESSEPDNLSMQFHAGGKMPFYQSDDASEDEEKNPVVPRGQTSFSVINLQEPDMKSYRKELWFNVPTRRAFINITPEVQACIDDSRLQEGLVFERGIHISS